MVSLVVIAVEGSLSEGEGSADGLRVLEILRRCCQVLVDVVHGRNHSADVGHVTRKEEGPMLENLMLK